MRLIDADALLEALGDGPISWTDTPEEIQAVNDWREFVSMINDTPTIGGWISVKDRLPNSNGCYIVWRPHFYPNFGMPSICYFDGSDTWHDSYGVDFERILNAGDVTHWMPLPERPEEVNGDG